MDFQFWSSFGLSVKISSLYFILLVNIFVNRLVIVLAGMQACGVLRAVEPLNSFLASLCKFTISSSSEAEKRRYSQVPLAGLI